MTQAKVDFYAEDWWASCECGARLTLIEQTDENGGIEREEYPEGRVRVSTEAGALKRFTCAACHQSFVLRLRLERSTSSVEASPWNVFSGNRAVHVSGPTRRTQDE